MAKLFEPELIIFMTRLKGDSSACLAVLRSINRELKEVENALEDFKSGCLQTEKHNLEQGKALKEVIPQYTERLRHIASHLPSHLPGANTEARGYGKLCFHKLI